MRLLKRLRRVRNAKPNRHDADVQQRNVRERQLDADRKLHPRHRRNDVWSNHDGPLRILRRLLELLRSNRHSDADRHSPPVRQRFVQRRQLDAVDELQPKHQRHRLPRTALRAKRLQRRRVQQYAVLPRGPDLLRFWLRLHLPLGCLYPIDRSVAELKPEASRKGLLARRAGKISVALSVAKGGEGAARFLGAISHIASKP